MKHIPRAKLPRTGARCIKDEAPRVEGPKPMALNTSRDLCYGRWTGVGARKHFGRDRWSSKPPSQEL